MGTGSAESGIQILCNYSIEDRYGLFGSGMKRMKENFKKKDALSEQRNI
jgi:hypothetical protein